MILSICDNLAVLQATLIIKTIIKIICILAPIFLILTSIISLTKAILNSDDNALKSSVKILITKFIIAAFIFMIPTIFSATAQLASPNNDYRKCIAGATKERIKELKVEETNDLVELAKKNLTSHDYTNALNAVNKLNNSAQKSAALKELQEIKKDIDTKEKVINIIKEGTEEAYASASKIVNSLSDGDLKKDLTSRLTALRKQLDLEKNYVSPSKPYDEPTDDLNGGSTSNLPEGTSTYVSGNLEVHFINPNSRVDAIFIKVGDKSLFIDGGFKSDAKKEIAYMDKIGVTHIDYYIGTHSHKDHIEAAPAIIQRYGIKNVIVGRETCKGSGNDYCSWYTIKLFANEQNINLYGVNVRAFIPGDSFTLNGLKITCLGPLTINNSLNRGDGMQNYNSLFFRLEYGSKSFMMTGDNTSSKNIKASYEKYGNLMKVDVLKNPHHNGNIGASSYNIFGAKYVVFTTNSGSLPNSSCLNTVKSTGADVYVVANGQDGNVVFTTDGTKINTTKKYNP